MSTERKRLVISRLTSKELARFESNFIKGKLNDCWNWLRPCTTSLGYEVMQISKKQEYAHRASWRIYKGPIPKGLCVLHKCDNPKCVNPNHLFLGTLADNMYNMWTKGRGNPGQSYGENNGSYKHQERRPRGEQHGMAKLTDEDITQIRKLHTRGCLSGKTKYSGIKLAEMFGVHKKTTYKIVNGVAWKHVKTTC